MQGVRPCPYCGGEVEVVKLVKKEKERKTPYRIECRKCRALVARGFGFPNESEYAARQRIEDYDRYMKEYWDPNHSTKIKISEANKARDLQAAKSSRISYDDEQFEIHDAGHRNGNIAKRGTSVYDT